MDSHQGANFKTRWTVTLFLFTGILNQFHCVLFVSGKLMPLRNAVLKPFNTLYF